MLEDLLTELADRGWYLYSLYNLPLDRPLPFQWECTIRYPGEAPLVSYGQGPSAYDAIANAIDGIERAQPHQLPTFTVTEESRVSIADIITKLSQPAEPIKRRI